MARVFQDNHLTAFKANGSPGNGAILVSGASSLIYPVIFTGFRITKREKVQTVEAFDETNHLYAFGKSADVVQLSGMVMDSVKGTAGSSGLMKKYDSEFRAFKSAEKGKMLVISGIAGSVISGTVDSLEIAASAETDCLLSFSLSLLCVDHAFNVNAPASGKSGAAKGSSSK